MIPTILLQSLFMALAFFGPMFLFGELLGAPQWLGLALPLCFALAGHLVAAKLGRYRGLFAVVLSLLSVAVPLVLFGICVQAVLAAAFLVAVVVLSVRMVYGPNERMIDTRVAIAGVVMYFSVAVLAVFVEISETGPLGAACLAFMLLSMLLINHITVKERSGQHASRLLPGNRLLSFLLLALTALVVFFKSLRDLIGGGIFALVSWLFTARETVTEPLPPGELPPEEAGQSLMDLFGESVRPAWLDALFQVLQVVFTVVTILAVLGFVCFVVYKLGKALPAALRRLSASFKLENERVADYQEESEQLMDLESIGKQMRQEMGQRIKKLFTRPVPWEKLTPRQKVRRLYETLLAKLSPYTPQATSMTPEQLQAQAGAPEEFSALYNRARYSDAPITNDSADDMRAKLKGII